MNRPFKFRYVNEISGGFVLLGVGLLIAGIYLAGHAQGWFQKKLVLNVKFATAEGTYGLQEGAEVRILGTLAGRMGEIVPGPNGGMESTLIIKRKFRNFVRANSIAKVRKKFQVFGDAFVEVTLGDAAQPMLPSGSYIPVEQDVELIEAARKMVDDFRAAAVPMLDEFRQILSHVNGVTRQLEQHEGAAGKFIGDPEWSRQIDQVVKDVRQTSDQLPEMTHKLDTIMADFKRLSESVNTTAARFPDLTAGVADVIGDAKHLGQGLTGQVANVQGVLLQTQSTLRETERLIQGLQRHWLVRRYIEQADQTLLMSPAEAIPAEGGNR